VEPSTRRVGLRKEGGDQKGERKTQEIAAEQQAPDNPAAALGPLRLSTPLEQFERAGVDGDSESVF
jgi:hypothetical protein